MSAAPRLVVVGLGPAGADLLSLGALAALESASEVCLRTSRHPAAAELEQRLGDATMVSFDSHYERGASFEEVYAAIAEELVGRAAAAHVGGAGAVVYAVPGSPLVAERTVELLRADDRVALEVVPALSFVDLAWARLGIDPVAAGARLVDAAAFAVDAAGDRGPLLVAQCWSRQVLSSVKLSLHDADGAPAPEVTLLHHLGLPDEQVVTTGWWELDRVLEPDHLTTLWVPHLGAPIAGEVARVEELVRTLRHGCPWDREQTHRSLTAHLVEESYEAIDALEALGRALEASPAAPAEGPDRAVVADACEELGDVLFQVVFHAVLASEEGLFTLADVARGVHDKLVGRHPHVFGTTVADTPEAVAANWEVLKKAEKGRASVTEGIPSGLPALALAAKLLRKATSVGLVPASAGDLRRALGALAEPGMPVPDGAAVGMAAPDGAGVGMAAPDGAAVDMAADGAAVGMAADGAAVGAALLALVDLARRAGVDPESALRRTALELRDRIVAAEGAPGS
ncbi:MAG TPA: MazG nucleotide pyrophosphohydrolase domain-containing protein [Acidimicrobiales bacterium]